MVALVKLYMLQKIYGTGRYHKVGQLINIAEEHLSKSSNSFS